MKEIQLTQGFVSIIDDDDFERVSKIKWNVMGRKPYNKYAQGRPDAAKGSRKWCYLHRFIMNAPNGVLVDHINGNTLDNRKCNLRFCTVSQNNQNSFLSVTNKSGFKGVSYHAGAKKYAAFIRAGGKHIYLGLRDTAEEAAKLYQDAAKKHFGEFARF